MGSWPEALELPSVDVVHVGKALLLLRRVDNWLPALELLRFMSQRLLRRNDIVMNSVVTLCGWSKALQLLLEMRFRGIEYNRKSFASAFKEWSTSLSSFKSMKAYELQPDLITRSACVRMARLASWRQSQSMFSEAKTYSLRPNAQFLTGAITDSQWQALLADQNCPPLDLQNFQVLSKLSWSFSSALLEHMALNHVKKTALRAWQAAAEATEATWLRSLANLEHALRSGAWQSSVRKIYLTSLKSLTWQSGLLVFKKIFKRRVSSNSRSAVISMLEDAQWASALHYFNASDVILSSSCISACEWQRALKLFDLSRGHADVVLYNAILSVLESKWQLALHFYDEMLRVELLPDEITYSCMISACEKGLQWEQSLIFLEKMKEKDVIADVIALNSAISAAQKSGQWQIALSLLESMRISSLADEISFNSAIGACETAIRQRFSGLKKMSRAPWRTWTQRVLRRSGTPSQRSSGHLIARS